METLVYGDFDTYLGRGYAGHVGDRSMHVPIEYLHAYPGVLWVIVDYPHVPRRPDLERSPVIIYLGDLREFMPADPDERPRYVRPETVFFDPRRMEIVMRPHGIWPFRKVDFRLRVDRYFGPDADRPVQVGCGWFYDHSRHRLNFICRRS